MTSLRNKLLALGDSSYTAKFQNICGIKSNKDVSHKCNGVNKKIRDNHSANGAGSVNGAAVLSTNGSANGCDSSVKPYVNGLVGNHYNGGTHIKHISNGLPKEWSDVMHKNGFSKTRSNGVAHSRLAEVNKRSKSGADAACETHDYSNGSNSNQKLNGHVSEQMDSENSPPYTIENILLYYVFSFGASLGNEVFYILFFTTTLWNFDSFVVRKMLILWCVIMYVGQAAKDIIRWPRPRSPPAIHLEERYSLEYGMPSTHAMVGVAIPFGMLIYMSGRYEFNFVLGLIFCTTWSVLVSFSRLYLGMHSALDIIAGLVFAALLMLVTYPFVDLVDQFLISHPNALPIMVATCITLCLLYPPLDKWSTARGDTTLVLAVFSGIYAGMWMTGQYTEFEPMPDSPPYVLGVPSLGILGLVFLRQLLGVAVVVVVLTLLKLVALHTFSWLFGFDPKDPETKQHLVVELPYKYVCYFLSSAIATYCLPLLFLWLNIERQGYYSEIMNPKFA